MKTCYYIFISALLFILTYSCKKVDIQEFNPDYIGIWHSEPYTVPNGTTREKYFDIGTDNKWGNNCDTNCTGCNCTQEFNGVRIYRKGKKITVGKSTEDGSTHFKVNQDPKVNSDGVWTCIIDDVKYYKE